MYEIVALTLNEGGEWYPVKPSVTTTDGELQTAMDMAIDKYGPTGRQTVAKLPRLGTAFHSLRMESGEEWDAINGWRS